MLVRTEKKSWKGLRKLHMLVRIEETTHAGQD